MFVTFVSRFCRRGRCSKDTCLSQSDLTTAAGGRASRTLALTLASPLVLVLAQHLHQQPPAADLVRLLLNALPFILVWAVLRLLLARPLLALFATLLLQHLFHAVHALKLAYLEHPLVPGDLLMLPQVLRDPALFGRYAEWDATLLLLALGLAVSAWLERGARAGRWRWRAPALGLLLVGTLGLAQGWKPWPSLYSDDRLGFMPWAPRASAEQSGAVAHFLRLAWSTRMSLPAADRAVLDGFNASRFDALAERLARTPPETPPDIIILQSESLFDPGRVNGIDGEQHLSHFRALRARGIHGDLRVPAYGGMTTRTEFEVLTGYPLRAFGPVEYPYQGLVHRPLYALPRQLADLGYSSLAVHPYEAHFYRRDLVYPRLGFEHFLDARHFRRDDYYGYFISDSALTRKLIELLDDGHPQFLFAVSMENHGPWDAERPVDPRLLEDIEVPSTLHVDDVLALRQFLHHLRRSDEALMTLVEHLARRERETWLLFFGDHLPALPEVFASLGFRDGRSAPAQPVPFLLLNSHRDLALAPPPGWQTTEGANRDPGHRIDLESHQLAALLMDAAQLPADAFLAARAELLHRPADGQARIEEELARDHYRSAQGEHDIRPESVADLVEVMAWGPVGTEALARRGDASTAPSSVWIRVNAAATELEHLALRLGRETLPTHHDQGVLVATLDPSAQKRLLASPGVHELSLIHRRQRLRQPVGEFAVRARGARARLAHGGRAADLCAIERWGPQETPPAPPANMQPDGSMGLWFVADCWPRRANVEVAGVTLPGIIDDRLLTTALPAELLPGQSRLAVSIRDGSSGESLDVGFIRVEGLPSGDPVHSGLSRP
jgi:hypothetical protein